MPDLVNLPRLLTDFYTISPDPDQPGQKVAFGTSGHRGTAGNGSFNEAHILAITQAIADVRRAQGTSGPLFLAKDSHALSEPAFAAALEVLAANEVAVIIQAGGGFTPTPVISREILVHNHLFPDHPADGILITPSHNPPEDGGFKYNPPHGGPADTDVTSVVETRANALITAGLTGVRRMSVAAAMRSGFVTSRDFVRPYVEDLSRVLDMEAIRSSGLRIGIDPMGGASVDYWAAIIEHYRLTAELVNPKIDPTFAFMPPDWDGRIRMDCSSPHAMANLLAMADRFDLGFGNDTDADRHGIVSGTRGLMNANHFQAVAIDHLFRTRSLWPRGTMIGKTVVSSAILDRTAQDLGIGVYETPVGFKWFVDGLLTGRFGMAGEESAGAVFLRPDGKVWTTDKDGMTLCLLAAEAAAKSGRGPAEAYDAITARLGAPVFARVDAPASPAQKAALKALGPETYPADHLGGEPIVSVLTKAPGNGASIGGIKVTTANGWFAARPSGTENVYKVYAESFKDADHLAQIQADARDALDRVFAGAGAG